MMIVSASRGWKEKTSERKSKKKIWGRGKKRRRRRGSENERGMKKNPLWPPSSSAESGYRLYVGARLQSPEKQICGTFRLKCQRAAGIDFLLSSE